MNFAQNVTLQALTGGHSGAQIFKMSFNGQEYCLKFPRHSDVASNFPKMQEICQIYQTLSIKSLELFGHGYAGEDQKQFYLFHYIPGEDFKTFSNQHSSLAEIHEAGIEVGREAKKLKSYPIENTVYIERENLTILAQHIIKLYNELADLLSEYHLTETLAPLVEIIQKGPEIFSNIAPGLIHGDIKRSNIVIDPVGNKYFIDIGAMKYSYDVLNFRYQMTWLLFPENQRKREFARGFFDGLYDFVRPTNFELQVIFVTLLNFLEHTYKFRQDQQEIEWYCARMQPILERLAKSGGISL